MNMISLTVLLLLKIKFYNLQYWRVPNSILQLASGWIHTIWQDLCDLWAYLTSCLWMQLIIIIVSHHFHLTLVHMNQPWVRSLGIHDLILHEPTLHLYIHLYLIPWVHMFTSYTLAYLIACKFILIHFISVTVIIHPTNDQKWGSLCKNRSKWKYNDNIDCHF